MEGFTTELIVVGLLVSGALLHGVTGLGYPMVSTMSVAMLVPLPTAIALVALPNIIINLMVLTPSKSAQKAEGVVFFLKKHGLLIVSSVIGCMLGVLFLKNSPVGWMYLLLSLATLFYIFYSVFGGSTQEKLNIKIKESKISMIILGGLAGIVGGATNAMSSILMMYLLAASDNKNEIVKTSNVCFLLAKVVQIFLLQHELVALNSQEIVALLTITVFSMMALFLGIKIRNNISTSFFKNLVLLVLLALSIQAGWRAIALL